MKYISEERLREKFRSLYWSNGTEEELLKALINECKELNQWQPIEYMPKARRILLLYEDGDVRIDWWYHKSQQDNKIVAWTEIPETLK